MEAYDSLLREGESIEDLQYEGLVLIQSKDLYRFTSDAVLLANYVSCHRGDRALELGAGSGVISILVSAKTGARVVGLEIQPCMADMARRSVGLNGYRDRVEIVEGDIKEAEKIFGYESFDVVFSNPPYRSEGTGERTMSEVQRIARHEILVTLGEVVEHAAKTLRFGGKFYMIIQAERLAESIRYMMEHKLEPKDITAVYRKGNTADTVMITAIKGGMSGVKVSKL